MAVTRWIGVATELMWFGGGGGILGLRGRVRERERERAREREIGFKREIVFG